MSADCGRSFSAADLETMPDDGRRYELVDDELLVSAAPGLAHQEMVLTLGLFGRAAALIAPSENRQPTSDR